MLAQLAAEAAVLCLINEARADAGVQPLTLNTRLRTAARKHAEAAKALKWWAGGGPAVHVNPQTGSTPQRRIHDEGYCQVNPSPHVGENAYDGFYTGGAAFQQVTSPQAAMDWWMNSPPHRDNLLDPTYNESGVAVVLGVAEQGPEADAADGGAIFVQTFGFCDKPEIAVQTEAWAWGANGGGQIGDGTNLERDVPVQPHDPENVVAVACGYSHSLSVKGDGSVWAWGNNDSGQVGDGTTTDRNTPHHVRGIDQITAVAGGELHSIALRNDGTVWAWGRNRYGQLGDGTNTDRVQPVKVGGLDGVTKISAGESHNLALKSNGSVWGWGSNNFGELGIGSFDDHINTPRMVQPLFHNRVSAIAAGQGFGFSLAVEAGSGNVWAWGNNHEGQLGDGGSHPWALRPMEIPNFDGVIAVAAGRGHCLALKKDGTVWAWGNNDWGQLGDNTTNQALEPVQVVGLSNVIDVAAGIYYSMALRKDGTIWAWGWNIWGSLGDGTMTERHTPVQVANVRNAVATDGGLNHSLAAAQPGLKG